MTRRKFMDSICLYGLTTAACRAQGTYMDDKLHRWEERSNVGILSIGFAVLNVSGDRVGRLQLLDSNIAEVSVAPDHECVAWIPMPLSAHPVKPRDSLVLVKDGVSPVRELHYDGQFGRLIAISSNAATVVLVVKRESSQSNSLLLLRPSTNEDLMSLLTDVDAAAIERLSLSEDGSVLAAGSRTSYVVIELESKRVLVKGEGRFPAISPDGKRLAYVAEQEQLVCYDIHQNSRRLLQQRFRACGVGGWSADSRYVLAGKRTPFSPDNRLMVVDVADDQAINSFKLGEGDYGNKCVWISRRLVTA